MAFPVSPTNGQTAVVNGIVYLYSSADNAWSRFSTPPGNLTVTSNLTSSGNLIASNVYLSRLSWSNGAPFNAPGTYSNSNVSSYLTSGLISVDSLSVSSGGIQTDALNLNNNNLYNVNTIRINDPGTSEGIAWEGGSGWSIYESPNDLSNATGNLQIVLSGTRVFTVDTNQTVNIPGTSAATSSTTGALTVGGGVGIGGNLFVSGNIFASNIVSVNSTTLTVSDPLLYLTANTPFPYNYDIGFFSHFVGGNPTPHYQHTGFSRSVASNTWILFSNISSEPGSTIDWTEANIIYDPIKIGAANIANTTVSTSTTTGALIVGGGAGIGGNLFVGSNLSIGSSAGIGGNLSVSGNISISSGTTLIDALNLNNNNLYNVNNIRISDPGTSEGITWEGGSGWSIYESPDSLSNDIGNLQVVLNGTRTFTIASDGTINIPNSRPATSTVTGALTIGGGLGVTENVFAGRIYTEEGLFWAGNYQVISTGGGAGGSLSSLSDVAISGPTSGQVLKYNGSQWVNGTDNTGSGGGGGGSGITFTADSVAPLSANVADQWYDTTSDILFEYINDGDSSQWVDISSGPISANTRVNLSSSGNLQIFGHFFPGVDNTFDLGNVTYSWRNLQLDGRATVANITTTNGIFYSNGASASYANTRVAEYLPVYSGNVSAANLTPTTSGGNLTVSNGSLIIDTGGNLVIRDGFINPGDTGSIGVNSTVAVTNGNITVMSGSVGIGTTTPAGSLEVTGDVLISNNGNLTVAGNIVQQEAYYEIYSNVAAVGGNLTCNFTNGTIFNVTSISSNVTANFTNVNSLSFGATAATIVIKQSSPAYIVSNIQINGVMQTINWANGIGNQSAPAGLANNTDVISFSLLHLGSGTWRVLGQLGSYA